MAEQCQQVSPSEQAMLLNILKKFEDVLDGSIGTWNISPVDLELNDDANPVYLRTYPVPRVHEVMFRNEVEILVKLGVLKESNDSEWGAPSFAQPKAKQI